MKLGLFLMPSPPPERRLYNTTEWDLEIIQYADALGYDEAKKYPSILIGGSFNKNYINKAINASL